MDIKSPEVKINKSSKSSKASSRSARDNLEKRRAYSGAPFQRRPVYPPKNARSDCQSPNAACLRLRVMRDKRGRDAAAKIPAVSLWAPILLIRS